MRYTRPRWVITDCAVCKSSFKVRGKRGWALHIFPACSSDCALELINSSETPVNFSGLKVIDTSQFRRGFKSRSEILLYNWLKKHKIDFLFESIGIKLRSGVYIPDFVLMNFGVLEVKDLTMSKVNVSKVIELSRYIPAYIVDASQVARIAR